MKKQDNALGSMLYSVLVGYGALAVRAPETPNAGNDIITCAELVGDEMIKVHKVYTNPIAERVEMTNISDGHATMAR